MSMSALTVPGLWVPSQAQMHKYHTTYGIVKKDTQDRAQIEQLCSKVGLHLVKASSNAEHFNLYCEKI